MLIVAMPKTASTSLMKTLGRAWRIPAEQIVCPEQPVPEGYSTLARMHSDMRILPDGMIERAKDRSVIRKQHVLPVEENLSRLSEARIVLLVRLPEDIVLAYRRGVLRGTVSNAALREYPRDGTPREWLAQARRDGLLKQLHQFYNGWINSGLNCLTITFRHLTEAPRDAIQSIQRFWGFEQASVPSGLAKERYTRFGLTGALVRRLRTAPRSLLALARHRRL